MLPIGSTLNITPKRNVTVRIKLEIKKFYNEVSSPGSRTLNTLRKCPADEPFRSLRIAAQTTKQIRYMP